jgi:uroporphyrinogen decarboxylase
MKEQMSPRERFLTAVKNEKPDRVPACPCLSYMIPAKRTGKPFWDVFLHNDPPVWKAYLEAVDYYGIDGRMIYGGLEFTYKKKEVETKTSIIEKNDEKLVTKTIYKTPKGDLDETTIYQVDNPPTVIGKMIKDIRRDLPAFKCLFPAPTGYKAEKADAMRKAAGEKAVFCLNASYPGFHYFTDVFEGGLEGATYAYMDYPDLFEELRRVIHDDQIKKTEMVLDYGPDILYMSASGTLTLSTPDWVRQFSLPTVKEVTRMSKQAGIPSMVHACGKSRILVEMFANETDLTCMNPLEQPPMGDCVLKEVNEKFGKGLALAGNVYTTEVMLQGTVEDVDRACRQAIEDAGKDGGFVLMTGDQCGRDTPEENIFAFMEAAKRYGRYS